jgi:hypothetical protein
VHTFVPGDSVATDDAGGFCDPGLDRQIARAAAEQTSNPAAAAAQWARLDRQLTHLAIWVPTVTPDEIDFLSSGVRNYQYKPGLGRAYRSILDPLIPVSAGVGHRGRGHHAACATRLPLAQRR